jgi:protein subunit release factor B
VLGTRRRADEQKASAQRASRRISTAQRADGISIPVKPPSDYHAARAARLARMQLSISDFEEKFARSSGPGGQHVNKVSTSVTLKHLPTGVSVTVQDSRSQSMNRQLAWTRLLDAIETARREERAARRAATEKERRRNAPRPWGVKQRILQSKRRRSATKQARRGGPDKE